MIEYKALSAFEQAALQKQYEWLWQNCKIVFFPSSDDKMGTYPIEHNPFARKDARGFIESKMDVSSNVVKKFNLGDKVQKTRGSQWHGTIVGTYSTELTPEGYAVESDTEKGSVQIYPVNALELMKED